MNWDQEHPGRFGSRSTKHSVAPRPLYYSILSKVKHQTLLYEVLCLSLKIWSVSHSLLSHRAWGKASCQAHIFNSRDSVWVKAICFADVHIVQLRPQRTLFIAGFATVWLCIGTATRETLSQPKGKREKVRQRLTPCLLAPHANQTPLIEAGSKRAFRAHRASKRVEENSHSALLQAAILCREEHFSHHSLQHVSVPCKWME